MLSSVKSRLGDLWWYALVLFCVQRLGDVINIFIGLWLVPKYVPQEELGAVLPLAQIGGVLGLPIAILLIPFGKFLNVYAARGELGKVKSLLRDVFLLAAVAGVVIALGALKLMPRVFERMRIQSGLLVWLIVFAGVTTTLAPLFSQALQALKKFRYLSFAGILSVTIRLVVLLVTLPIRGLSGYFCGQISADGTGIAYALFGLRRVLSPNVRCEPYLHHWRELIGYMLPIAFLVICGRVQGAAEYFVIRHRLPEVESAAYYFLTRFAEIPVSLWGAIGIVFVPLVSERHETGQTTEHILKKTITVMLLGGGAMAMILHGLAPYLFRAMSSLAPYDSYASLMGVASMTCVLRSALACFIAFELACRRFRFVMLACAAYGFETLFLYGVAGIAFFRGRVPDGVIAWIQSADLMRLQTLVWLFLWFSGVLIAVAAVQVTLRGRSATAQARAERQEV